MLELLGEAGDPACAGLALRLVGGGEPEAVQQAALAALRQQGGDDVAAGLLRVYPHLGERLRGAARDVLLDRRAWALALLQEVDRGRIAAKEVPLEQLRPVALFGDRQLDALVRKHWGAVRASTPGEKLAEVRRLNNDLRAGGGDARRGREVFRTRCASCHRLFGEGGAVGPDLTHANRKDREHLLVSIVDPGAVVRREYVSYRLVTKGGRVHTGLLAEATDDRVSLIDARGERVVVPRGQVERLGELPGSLMPEDLLKDLRPQQVRDLFGYLQADAAPPP
jgi:putative heme-binding domain-containing protein